MQEISSPLAAKFKTHTVEKDLGYTSPCWVWQRAKRTGGYPSVTLNKKSTILFRLMYEEMIGPIPDGLVLDHVCHSSHESCRGVCEHRLCINPEHGEPVTFAENLARQVLTHCPKGHAKSYAPNAKWMRCTTCDRENARRYYRENKAHA